MTEDERFFSRQIYLVARRSVNSEAPSISSASKSFLSISPRSWSAARPRSPFICVMRREEGEGGNDEKKRKKKAKKGRGRKGEKGREEEGKK